MSQRSDLPGGGERRLSVLPVVSHYQARELLAARGTGSATATTSLDLGLSSTQVALTAGGVEFSEGLRAAWAELQAISEDQEHCFTFEDGALTPIRRYSARTSQTYSLWPTADAPALIISGFTMHRFKNITPLAAARAMVTALGPIRGRVVDTATGLGYTAGLLAQKALEVTTIELDPECQELAALNPWSRALFHDPKIQQIMGDSQVELGKFAAGSLHAVLHDPPSVSLAGDLYSGAFYSLVYRALGPRGRMFHYIGDPASALGAGATRGVVRRLYAAGFRKVSAAPLAYGVIALK